MAKQIGKATKKAPPNIHNLPPAAQKILDDPWEFIQRLYIVDKNHQLVQLKLNEEQKLVINDLLAGYSLVILKARQLGITTAVRAFQFWQVFRAKTPFAAASMCHVERLSKEMTSRDHRFLNNLPGPLRRDLSIDSTTDIVFKDSEASLRSFTASGEGGLRSLTIHSLHLSEFELYPDAEELLATAEAAVNGGQIIVESTAKNYGGPMWRLLARLKEGNLPGRWKLHFLPWFNHEEYRSPVGPEFSRTMEEDALSAEYGLGNEQLQFRREKIAVTGIQKFKCEYPCCPEDIFGVSDNSYYQNEDLGQLEIRYLDPDSTSPTREFESVDADEVYAIGVDAGAGVGRDFSFAACIAKTSGRVAAVIRSNELPPHVFSQLVQHLSMKYNGAKVIVEENSWGLPMLENMRASGFPHLWKKDGKNWSTTKTSKITLHEALKTAVQTGVLRSIDSITLGDLKSLVLEDPTLAPRSIRNASGHGDGVIAYGLAMVALGGIRTPSKTNTNRSIFDLLDSIQEEPEPVTFGRGF